MGNIRAYLISHTHWDREWYLTQQEFQSKMVRLVDSVLESVEGNPDLSFMLDGQTIVLEDYLQIRPENEERLRKAISGGRLCVGPWYILPDELLVSGEAHIRNYLTGQKIAKRFGGGMNVGYLPDSFGHPQQMPQILSGLSMDTAVFWRGIPNDITEGEFRWDSACPGKGVLAVNMPHGYGNSARLTRKDSLSRLKAMMIELSACSRGDVVLLMNGSDHILNQKDICEIVEDFNREAGPDYHITIGTMEQFLGELKQGLKPLSTWAGELRSGDRSMLLSGTMSTRVYLKQRNSQVQRGMERYLEPAAVLEKLAGLCSGFAGYQRFLWKKILENHPHDSICGCSVDPVHAEMMTRFNRVEQAEKTVFSDILGAISKKAAAGDKPQGVELLCFEPCQDSLPAVIETQVDFDPMLVQRVNFAKSTIDEYEGQICHPALPCAVNAYDEAGNPIPARLLQAEKAYYNHLQDATAPEIYKVNRCKVALSLPAMSYGLHTITLVPEYNPQGTGVLPKSGIENRWYAITGGESGSFTVTDKRTGRVYEGFAKMIDGGDAGDEYTYSWPVQDREYTLEGAAVVRSCVPGISQSLRLEGVLRLPRGLTADRSRREDTLVDNPVSITLTLSENSPYVDISVEVENRAKDHRLQLEIPTGVNARFHDASSAFALTRRPMEFSQPEEWMERRLPTYPTHGYVQVQEGEQGVAVVCPGIYEYQADNDQGESRLRLTLLRCVGWLSRVDLLTRKGNGGWCYETPEAQCLGKHTFRVGVLYPKAGDNPYGWSDRIAHPPVVQQVFAVEGKVTPENPLAFLSQLPENVRLSACKPSEDEKGVAIRLFCLGEKESSFTLTGLPFEKAYLCDLREENRVPADYQEGVLNLTLAGGEIQTLYFPWEAEA